MASAQTQRFLDFLGDFKSLFGWVSKGVLLLPLAAMIATVGPPWPSVAVATTITGLVELCVLLWVFVSHRPTVRLTKVAGVLAFAGIVAYLTAYSFFAFSDPVGARDVKGFMLNEEVRQVIRPTVFTVDKALAGAEYDPFRIWAPWSVHTVRIALIVLWLFFVGALTWLFGQLVTRLHSLPTSRRKQ